MKGESQSKGSSTFDDVFKLAKSSKGLAEEDYRTAFIKLVETCKLLSKRTS